jgi:hypothetical protein
LSWKTATTKVGRPARRSVAGAAIGERKSIQVRHVAVALDAVDVIEQPAFLELVQRREQPGRRSSSTTRQSDWGSKCRSTMTKAQLERAITRARSRS